MNDPPFLAGGRRKWRDNMVREERLELSRIAPLDPKSSAYASFATLARRAIYCKAMNLTQLRAVGKRRRVSFPRSGLFPAERTVKRVVFREGVFVPADARRARIVSALAEGRFSDRAERRKGPSEDVPAGLRRGARRVTRRRVFPSASPSWNSSRTDR